MVSFTKKKKKNQDFYWHEVVQCNPTQEIIYCCAEVWLYLCTVACNSPRVYVSIAVKSIVRIFVILMYSSNSFAVLYFRA